MSARMSLSRSASIQLFQQFMPRREEIRHWAHQNVYDLREYPLNYFDAFDPARMFTKWAAMEVIEVQTVPDGMQVYRLQGGTYAVFQYKGPMGDPAIYQDIYSKWLPYSGYALDHRPHFDILGPRSIAQDPNSEEEIWIPIR